MNPLVQFDFHYVNDEGKMVGGRTLIAKQSLNEINESLQSKDPIFNQKIGDIDIRFSISVKNQNDIEDIKNTLDLLFASQK